MALGTRAISRIQGSGNGGFSGAKKVADLYAATNTNASGEVKEKRFTSATKRKIH